MLTTFGESNEGKLKSTSFRSPTFIHRIYFRKCLVSLKGLMLNSVTWRLTYIIYWLKSFIGECYNSFSRPTYIICWLKSFIGECYNSLSRSHYKDLYDVAPWSMGNHISEYIETHEAHMAMPWGRDVIYIVGPKPPYINHSNSFLRWIPFEKC
jgi:hypothetical protein